MKRNIRQMMMLTTLAAGAFGLGLLGAVPAAHAHDGHKWVLTAISAQAPNGQWLNVKDISGIQYVKLERGSTGPHIEIVSPYPWPQVSYPTPLSTLQEAVIVAPKRAGLQK